MKNRVNKSTRLDKLFVNNFNKEEFLHIFKILGNPVFKRTRVALRVQGSVLREKPISHRIVKGWVLLRKKHRAKKVIK